MRNFALMWRQLHQHGNRWTSRCEIKGDFPVIAESFLPLLLLQGFLSASQWGIQDTAKRPDPIHWEALISHVMSRDLFTSNRVTLYLNKGHPFPKVEWKQTAAHSGTTLGGVTDFYSVHIEICSVLSFSSIRQALFPCYFYFKRTQPKLYANPFKGVNTQVSPRIKWTEFTSVAATLSLGLLDEDLQMNKTENPFLPHCSTGREKVG